MRDVEMMLLLLNLLVFGMMVLAFAGTARGQSGKAPPRSDGRVLHVDFENYIDDGINFLNAGVRWVGDPFTDTQQKEVTILNDPKKAYAGKRCAYVFTDQVDQKGRIALQRRAEVADAAGREVTEFVFRVTASKAVELENFVVWSSGRYTSGRVGLILTANGTAKSKTYSLDVEDASGPKKDVVTKIKQSEWVRIILDRERGPGKTSLWVGPPGREKLVGTFADFNPQGATGSAGFGDLSTSEAYGSGYWDDVRIGGKLASKASVAPVEPPGRISPEMPKPSGAIRVGRLRQLFVDDYAIQSMRNLTRTPHAVTKHSKNPIMVPDQPWETQAKSIIPMTVMRDEKSGLYRVWYSAWGKQVDKPTYECLAESRDGIRWTKPKVGLVDFNGSKNNNILREGRMFRVLYDPRTTNPAERYKAVIRDAGFIRSYSPDGLRWTKTDPVLDQAYDATSVHWDPVGEKWIGSCKIFYRGKRVRGYAESKDFITWSDTRLMLTTDAKDPPKDELYSLAIVPYESIYVGLMKIYHTDTDRCDVQLAFSRDGMHWQRPFRTALISFPDKKGAWDWGNIDHTDSFLVVGDELRFYYGGRSTKHNESPNDGSMGLGTLRRDGFVSLDAGKDEGTVTTAPVILKGRNLYVNADAAKGQIRVELLEEAVHDRTTDEADVPVYPFTKDRCAPIARDVLSHKVQWQGVSDLDALGQKPVRIQFHVKNAKLYSFWTE